MKHIKKFENNNIKIGDYVLVNLSPATEFSSDVVIKAKEYIKNHIGKLVGINTLRHGDVRVVYMDVPEYIRSYFGTYDKNKNLYYRSVDIDQIVEFGSTPEELELKLSIKKYNL